MHFLVSKQEAYGRRRKKEGEEEKEEEEEGGGASKGMETELKHGCLTLV